MIAPCGLGLLFSLTSVSGRALGSPTGATTSPRGCAGSGSPTRRGWPPARSPRQGWGQKRGVGGQSGLAACPHGDAFHAPVQRQADQVWRLLWHPARHLGHVPHATVAAAPQWQFPGHEDVSRPGTPTLPATGPQVLHRGLVIASREDSGPPLPALGDCAPAAQMRGGSLEKAGRPRI